MPARAFILTVAMTGDPSVPNLGIRGLVWEILAQDEMYVANIGRARVLLRKIGMDGAKTAFSGSGTRRIMSVLSHLGDDAKLLKDYHADGGRKIKALGWGVEENTLQDGFLAPHVIAGQNPHSSGRNYR